MRASIVVESRPSTGQVPPVLNRADESIHKSPITIHIGPMPETADYGNRVAVIGGGAAGFFAAIAAAENGSRVILLEKSARVLAKVRISGGGRCNVTHACYDPRLLAEHYPRGGRALISLFHRFQARETIDWFEQRGVPLKTEPDGRIFPVSDSSQSIIDCLTHAAQQAGVELRTSVGLKSFQKNGSTFSLDLTNGETISADCLILATGGARGAELGPMLEPFGHQLQPPVPSLFTFAIPLPWLHEISGLATEAHVSVKGTKLSERGPVLVTHWGLSGPAILRLSAWGARILHDLNYQFTLQIQWLPDQNLDAIQARLLRCRSEQPGRLVRGAPLPSVPFRLWEKLVQLAGVEARTTWNRLPRESARTLAESLSRMELPVTGKSMNKEEFVTCGGVPLPEVDLKTMQSRKCPGLHFAGEILDIDGITGGFNFQAAWTTGWLAGRAAGGEKSE